MASLMESTYSFCSYALMAIKTSPSSATASSADRAGEATLSLQGGATNVSGAANLAFAQSCFEALKLSREKLLATALARGCRHYAGLWSELTPADRVNLPHEILGVALLVGPADAETFQAIRCGAMVLSDLDNSPELIAEASVRFAVAARVAHVARLGQATDDHGEFWGRILSALPPTKTEEEDFLPGVSRLVSETRISGLGRGPSRVWLRTNYPR